MVDFQRAGVSESDWTRATESCHALRVAERIRETHDSCSLVLEVPASLREAFAYRAGQFLSFKIPQRGKVLVRSYSLSSSPDTDAVHKITVKRVDDGRISNWINDEVREGDTLMVVPPAGFFVLNDAQRRLVFFGGGSGITPIVSLIKSALATTGRSMKLVYANRDERSIIFRRELAALAAASPDRLEVVHTLDDVQGYMDLEAVKREVGAELDADFYLCGPGAFMATVEGALGELGVHKDRIHMEHFVSPPDPDDVAERGAPEAGAAAGVVPETVTVVLDGETHEVPYQEGEAVLHAARRAGLEPPFSCEEGYCSCCMAKLVEGEVRMAANDCLTPELLEEGWVLTCQSRCVRGKVRVEYPD